MRQAPVQAISSTPQPIPSTSTPPTPASLSTSTPLPTPSIRIVVPGQRVESGDLALTVNEISKEATEEIICITISVTIENINHDLLPYSPLDFRVMRDAESLEQTTACGDNGQALAAGALSPGDQVQGSISFQQVFQNEAEGMPVPLFLIYQQLTIADGYQLMVLDLGPS
jgi:hypothetical protein